MKYAKTMGLGLLVAALAVTGCSNETKTPPTAKDKGAAKDSGKKEENHAHGNGPNGGVTFDMGKYHAEFTVDHPKKEVTVLFLKSVEGKKENDWPADAVAANEFTLSIKETKVKEGADLGKVVPPMTIMLKPVDTKDGKASKFVGTDPGVGNVADFEGTVLGEIDGKPSQGEFKE
ncbi:MAG: hypothetical protein AB7I48_10345 [Planctomycetaceae bacterium]